jgi:hypothetical protein
MTKPRQGTTAVAVPASITPYPTLDPGIGFRFRGIERNEDGEPIGEMIDIELEVPALNLYNLKRLEKHFKAVVNGADSFNISSMADIVEILVPALAQNYKGVPRWLVEQSVNLSNAPYLIQAVMDISGLLRKEIGEKKAKATKTSPSTGTALSAT